MPPPLVSGEHSRLLDIYSRMAAIDARLSALRLPDDDIPDSRDSNHHAPQGRTASHTSQTPEPVQHAGTPEDKTLNERLAHSFTTTVNGRPADTSCVTTL